ncbi:hypothetical protein [Bradyrhizobium sp. SZCCHNS3053]|uniref:hypothetical protein n=1 Tax=Bradyrhizobium sp. SZCCHNS3053 TaxID=3057322 RepID=UPI002915C582|nr:hypothetical protein [Bradyrhizobium sp. SZCCHNS3053]
MRIYTSQNDPIDFCGECAPDSDEAEQLYANLGDGPDGRGNCYGYDDDHPSYEGEGYRCSKCGVELKDDD